jgi:hypothetical protein
MPGFLLHVGAAIVRPRRQAQPSSPIPREGHGATSCDPAMPHLLAVAIRRRPLTLVHASRRSGRQGRCASSDGQPVLLLNGRALCTDRDH